MPSDTRPRNARCQTKPRLDVKSRGKKYGMRRRENRNAAAGRLQRQRAMARLDRRALGLQSVQRDTPQRAFRVVEDGLRAHVVARLTIGGRGHVESGVVVVSHVRVIRCQDGFLLNQPAARVERVSHTAVEAPMRRPSKKISTRSPTLRAVAPRS